MGLGKTIKNDDEWRKSDVLRGVALQAQSHGDPRQQAAAGQQDHSVEASQVRAQDDGEGSPGGLGDDPGNGPQDLGLQDLSLPSATDDSESGSDGAMLDL